MQSKKQQYDLCLFQGKPFSIMVIQLYAPTRNAEEAEVERFYEDLQDLLELTPKKDIFFIIGYWNEKVGNQEIPGVTGKFGLGVQNEAGKRLIEFCQENTLAIANTFFQHTREDFLYGCHQMVQFRLIILFVAKKWRSSIRSDQISCSVVSDSLRPHESQHARPPCPSPTPGVH